MDAAAVAHHRGAAAEVLRAVRAGCSDDGVGRHVAEAAGMLRDLGTRDGVHELLCTMHDLVEDLRAGGYPRLAVDVAKTAVALADATHHPELRVHAVQTREKLADALHRESGPEKARAVIDEARSIDEGLGCPRPLLTCNRLIIEGTILWDMGRTSESVASVEQAVAVATRSFGADSHVTADMQSLMGDTLLCSDRPSDALPLLQQAFPVLQRVLGPDDPKTTFARMTLGRAMVECGDLDGGLHQLRSVVATSERTAGPNSPGLMSAMGALGRALVNSRDPRHRPEAEAVLRKVLAISDRVHGRRHRKTMYYLYLVAVVLYNQGKVDEAEPLLHRVVAVGKDEGGSFKAAVEQSRELLLDIQTRRLHALPGGGMEGDPGAAEGVAHARDALLAGDVPPPACATCGATRRADGRPGDLRACAACRIVHYCSTACQRRGWREGGHKASCTRSRVEAKAGPEGRGRPGKGK